MNMQTFQGNSMAEALEKVKKALGPDAVILHTRTLRSGGVLGVGARNVVEITASRDASLLHPTERRGIIGRTSRPPLGGARGATSGTDDRSSRVSHAEGAAMTSSGPGAFPSRGGDRQTSDFTAELRGEMNELRAMVRELLDRQASAPAQAGPDLPAELREHYTKLIQNEVAEEIARDIMNEARARLREAGPIAHGRDGALQLADLIPQVMLESIERLLPNAQPVQIEEDSGPRYVAFVGPTGVGKTTTIAKLAAHFKLREQKNVGLITIDTYRIAAVEQLKAYAEIMGVPLEVVMTPEELTEALRSMHGMDLVLIDTSGRSQRDGHRLDELKTFLEAARSERLELDTQHERPRGPDGRFLPRDVVGRGGELEVHLVLSCTSNPSQIMDVARGFSSLGIDRVLFTKLDEAVGAGVILNVARQLDLRLSYLTTGQDVPDDIEVGYGRRIAELVLGKGDIHRNRGAQTRSAAIDHVA